MTTTKRATDVLSGLNEQQREAAGHGSGPLLIIAGAGTGKTKTLVHRVAHAIAQGVDPRRILLLTFTRRAAAEMLRRVETLLRQLGTRGGREAGKHVWGGTFHAIATRLLRMYGASIGLDPGFTIHDRDDSEDLLNVVRTDLGLAKTDKRFPKKGTCMAIYSRCLRLEVCQGSRQLVLFVSLHLRHSKNCWLPKPPCTRSFEERRADVNVANRAGAATRYH
jgi:DNA helicase-2/ATP-dependent DNA helicase PcrA